MPQVAEHRATESEGGKQDRLQARKILDIVEKYGMTQQVDERSLMLYLPPTNI